MRVSTTQVEFLEKFTYSFDKIVGQKTLETVRLSKSVSLGQKIALETPEPGILPS